MSSFNIGLYAQYGTRTYTSFDRALVEALKDVERAFDNSAKKISTQLVKFFENLAGEMEKRHSTPWKAGTTPSTLSKRSGGGIESIRGSIVTFGGSSFDDIQGRISTADLTVHETGAVIRPKRAKYLTIPLDEALDERGIPKKKSAREWDNTFIQRSRKGNLLIFQQRGRNIVPLYVLKKEVKIPPRLGMTGAFNQRVPLFQQRLLNTIDAELRNR